MVVAYCGIARTLWGSLPSERVFHVDRRSVKSSTGPPSATCRLSLFSRRSDDSLSRTTLNSSSSLMHSTKSANLTVQENRQKAAKMLISVVIIFAICYIPVHVFNLFR